MIREIQITKNPSEQVSFLPKLFKADINVNGEEARHANQRIHRVVGSMVDVSKSQPCEASAFWHIFRERECLLRQVTASLEPIGTDQSTCRITEKIKILVWVTRVSCQEHADKYEFLKGVQCRIIAQILIRP